jgi:hypothetical protein
MATTTNYGWTTPDDTALVKDGASAIRTLGSSVDTTTKNLNPETTLGDIAYRSSTSNVNTRLGIGSTGQVLTVAGGVPSWATAATPSSGANWSLLNSGGTALTGAQTVTVSGISSKDKIFIAIVGAGSENASATIAVRLNTDTGANYSNYGNAIIVGSSYADTNIRALNQTNDTGINISLNSNNIASTVTGYCLITGCNSSGLKVYNYSGGVTANGGNNNRHYNAGGFYNSASTISSISIFSTTGNLDEGTVYVYTSA